MKNREEMRYELLKTAYQAACADRRQQADALQAILDFAQANRLAGNGNQTQQQAELVVNVYDERQALLSVAKDVEKMLLDLMSEALAKSAVIKTLKAQGNKNG